jgi:PAS domain S-box-containing protein
MPQPLPTKARHKGEGAQYCPAFYGRASIPTIVGTTEKLRLLEAALQQTTDAIVMTAGQLEHPGPHIVYVNAAFTTLTGYTVAEIIGQTLRILYGPQTERAELEQMRRTLQAGQSFLGEVINYRKDGTTYVSEWQMTPIRAESGEITHWIARQRDVSERKHIEAAQTMLVAELQQAHADLQQFASVCSHDLQEPLRMVHSYSQLLAIRYQGKLDTAADEFIGYVVEDVQRMEALIHTLFTYCQLGVQKLAPVEIECEVLLEQTVADLHGAITESGAVITHDPLPTVRADTLQLKQALRHLIGNALKFRSSAPPCVHLTARRHGPQWVFAVQDNGIGLDPQQAARIFHVFQRLHRREQYAGTGIGLALCKKIIEQHGGRIWVESLPDQGTTFFFTLPAVEPVLR